MCKRHSFILTRVGKVHDGYGITDSHTTIRELAGLATNDDTVNAYEWQPPEGWPEADWHLGLTKDSEVFQTKSSHEAAMERHVRQLYPSMDAWSEGDVFRRLPDNLSMGGYLDLRGCTGLTSLPDNLSVGWYLDLTGCTGLTGIDLSGFDKAKIIK